MNLTTAKELVAWFEAQGIDDKAVRFEPLVVNERPEHLCVVVLPCTHPFWDTVPKTRAPPQHWLGSVAGVSVLVGVAVPPAASDYAEPSRS